MCLAWWCITFKRHHEHDLPWNQLEKIIFPLQAAGVPLPCLFQAECSYVDFESNTPTEIYYIYIASPMECLGMKLHGGASMAYTHHPEPNETWSVWELFLEQRRTPRPVAGHRPKLQKRIDHPCLAYLYTVYIPHRSMRHLFQSEGWPGNRLLPVTSPLNPTSRLSRCGRRKKPSRAYFAGRRD